MSVPVVPDYLESGDAAEHEKDRTQNKVIQNPGDACAEERQGGEQSKVARLGIHSHSRLERGSDLGCPPVRELMALNRTALKRDFSPRGRTAGHLSGSDRATRCPTGKEPAATATLVGQGRLAVSTVGKVR